MALIFQRIATTADTPITLEFEKYGIRYLVKNMSGGDIYVALGEETDASKCILIPDDTAQLVMEYDRDYTIHTNTVTIIPTATSETGVEVQCLRW